MTDLDLRTDRDHTHSFQLLRDHPLTISQG